MRSTGGNAIRMNHDETAPKPDEAEGETLAKTFDPGRPLGQGLALDDDTPLTGACDLAGDGTCEACQ